MYDDADLKSHEDMWHGFIRLTTYGTASMVVALALMAFFLL